MKALSFLLVALSLGLVAPRVSAADASFFGVIKLQEYAQQPGGSPAPSATNAFSFQAFVIASTNRVVTNATVSFKLGSATVVRTLEPLADGLGLRFEERFGTQSTLDAAYPAGSGFSVVQYTNSLSTVNDGVRIVNLNFWLVPPLLAVSYPATPAVANLAEAQAIDGSADFTLRWNSVGTALTLLQLTILDGASNLVFATPIPFQTGALNGTSTSVVIPAHTLPVGALLQGHLTAANPGIPNTNTYAGSIGVPALARDLVFPLATVTVPPPTLTIQKLTDGRAEILLTGASNRVHRLDASDDFLRWIPVVAITNAGTEFRWTDPASVVLQRRHYRGITLR